MGQSRDTKTIKIEDQSRDSRTDQSRDPNNDQSRDPTTTAKVEIPVEYLNRQGLGSSCIFDAVRRATNGFLRADL